MTRGGRDLLGAMAGVVGAGLIARAFGAFPQAPRGAPLTLCATVRVARPVEECFDAWSDPARLPRFLSHLKAVREFEDGRLRFTLEAGARDLDLDVILTRFEPPRAIAWRSLGGAALAHSGFVGFARDGRRTLVSALLTFATPARFPRDLVPGVLGPAPAGRLERDLARMKAHLESAPPGC